MGCRLTRKDAFRLSYCVFFVVFIGVVLTPSLQCVARGPVWGGRWSLLEQEATQLAQKKSIDFLSFDTSALIDRGCKISVEDALFDQFVDSQCLRQLEVGVTPCPLDAAHDAWIALAGELRVDSLMIGAFSMMGFATLLLAGGVPDPRPRSTTAPRRAAKAVFFTVWFAVQGSQVFLMLMSLLSIFLGYHNLSRHFGTCLHPWQGHKYFGLEAAGEPLLHAVAALTLVWQPMVFMRLGILMLAFESLAMSSGLFSQRARAALLQVERLVLRAVWVGVVLTVLSWLICWPSFVLLLPLALGMLAVLALALGLLKYLRAKGESDCLFCQSKQESGLSNGLAWTTEGSHSSLCSNVAQSFYDVCYVCKSADTNVCRIVYSVLVASIMCPVAVFGVWMTFEVMECSHSVGSNVAIMYSFLMGSRLDSMRLPDILALAKELPDVYAAMGWLGDMHNYMEYEPANIFQNSRILISIQMVLAALKAVIAYGNAAIAFLSRDRCGLATVPIRALILADEYIKEQAKIAGQRGLSAVHHGCRAYLEVVWEAVGRDGRDLRLASQTLRGDRVVVLRALRQSGLALEFATEELKADRTVVSVAVCTSGQALEFAGDALKGDTEIVELATSGDRGALQFASRRLVLEAVKRNGEDLQHVGDIFQNDCEVVLMAVNQRGKALKFASDPLKADYDIVSAAVTQDGMALQLADDELREDAGIVILAVNQTAAALQFAAKGNCENRQCVLAAVSQRGRVLQFASEQLKADHHIVSAAVTQDGRALHFAAEKFKEDVVQVTLAVKQNAEALKFAAKSVLDNYAVVLAAVSQKGHVLQFASDRLKGDPDIVSAAVTQDGRALQFAADKCKGDVVQVSLAVKQNAEAFKFGAKSVLDDNDFVLAAVSRKGRLLQFASDRLKADPDIVSSAVRQDGRALQFAADKFKGDAIQVTLAVKQNVEAFRFAANSVRDNHDVVLAAVSQKGNFLKFASERLKADPDIVSAAVTQDGRALQFAAEKFKGDAFKVTLAVKQNVSALKFADKSVLDNHDVILAAVSQKGSVLQFASDRLKADPDIVSAAVMQGGSRALQFVESKLRNDKDIVRLAMGLHVSNDDDVIIDIDVLCSL